MTYQLIWIDCTTIDYPSPLHQHLLCHSTDPQLLAPLARFGQLHPLLVEKKDLGRHVLLAGFPQFQALAGLAGSTALCRLMPENVPVFEQFALQILHDLKTLQASPVLQALVVREACAQCSEDELLALLSLMGLKPQRHWLRELDLLLQLAPSAQLALHQGVLSPKAVRWLTLLSHPDQQALVELICLYHPGGSKQQKLVEMVTELTLRTTLATREIIGQWLDEKELRENIPQRTQRMLQALEERHGPCKKQAEERFNRLLRQLQPPAGLTIAPSPSFEDDSLEVRFTFSSEEQLRRRWQEVVSLVQQSQGAVEPGREPGYPPRDGRL